MDLLNTKLYCFRSKVHWYYCLRITFSANPVRCSEEPRGDQKIGLFLMISLLKHAEAILPRLAWLQCKIAKQSHDQMGQYNHSQSFPLFS